MNFRSYGWLALAVFLIGLVVLHQGWNHGPMAQASGQYGAMKTQQCSPTAGSTGKGMGSNTQQ